MNLRLYYIEFEADNTVEGRRSYAGPMVWLVQADDYDHADKLFHDRLKKNGLFLENADGSENHLYGIHTIIRRAGITEIS